ncbi:MAG: choice-of-anchor J domain-containing protein [Candidatus Zixiibacteriota bacterium]|nr:MAG: choice-of-anchor J domain-containing protein [candidate division Zixibacteria bacterium]
MRSFYLSRSKILLIIAGILVGAFFSALSAANVNTDPPPTITTVDTLLYENFNGTPGPLVTYPITGWTVIDSGVPEWDETSWARYVNAPYPQYWNGDLCRVMFSGVNAIGDWLISPMFDCGGETVVTFSYKQSHSNRAASDNDTIFVYGSTDGGVTWSNTIYMSTTTVGALNHPDTVIVDISSWAAANDSIKIAFYFKGDDVLTWYIDEPFAGGNVTDTLLYEDFNGVWGPYGNNPPAGWTIINEVSPDPPNNNDWNRWLYSTWPDTVASAYDNANDQTANEWLITPTLSFSSTAICSLIYYHNFWEDDWDDTDSAFVLGSTNGGLSWDQTIKIYSVDDGSTIKANCRRGFDISSWAQNQSDVKIAFRYIKDEPSYTGWWLVDDVMVTETPLGTDNVAALSFDNPSGFMVVGQSYDPKATVQNQSLFQQPIDMNLVIRDAGDTEVYNYTEVGVILDSLEIAQVNFSLPFVPASTGNHTFTARVINPGDQDPTDDTTDAAVAAFEHVATGGPDAFGYSFIDNTDPGGPTFDWIEISSTGTQIEPTSHYFMSGEIPLGFSMDFYGSTYSSMWVNSHGEIHLNARGSWDSSNDCPLPDISTPNEALLAVFWDRLYIHYEIGAGVYYQYFDNGDNDYMVVEWQAKVSSSSADTVVFEAILYENGEIIYQYNYVNDGTGGQGQTATVGMEYDVLPSGLTYYCNDENPANRLQDGLAIKWYFEGPGGCDYVVGDVNGSDNYNGLDITYGVAYFKGAAGPLCPDCPVGDCNSWNYCGDVNGSCNYNGLDITYGVAYFKGGPGPIHCPDCPPN